MNTLIFGSTCPSQIREAIALTVPIRGNDKHYNLRLATSEAMGISAHRIRLSN